MIRCPEELNFLGCLLDLRRLIRGEYGQHPAQQEKARPEQGVEFHAVECARGEVGDAIGFRWGLLSGLGVKARTRCVRSRGGNREWGGLPMRHLRSRDGCCVHPVSCELSLTVWARIRLGDPFYASRVDEGFVDGLRGGVDRKPLRPLVSLRKFAWRKARW